MRALLALFTVASLACSFAVSLDDLQAAHDAGPNLTLVDGPAGVCACVPAPPEGFRGPVAVWTGADAPPACDPSTYSELALDAVTDLTGAAATCGCGCSTASVKCPASLSLTLYGDGFCLASKCYMTLTTTCAELSCASPDGFRTNALVPSGSCTPVPDVKVPPAVTKAARACQTRLKLPASSCAPGAVCAPLPAPPYDARPCLIGAGDVTCPAGYGVKKLIFTSVTDTRGCSPCTCTTSGGCAAELNDDCDKNKPLKITNNMCGGISNASRLQLRAPPSFTGSCAAATTQPTGAVAGTSPSTLCCVP